MISLSPRETRRRHSDSSGFHQNEAVAEPRRCVRRSGEMDAQQLRAKAAYYRKIALLVSDMEASEALLELAAEYESLADDLAEQEPNPRGR